MQSSWNQRYDRNDFLFGLEPSPLLVEFRHLIPDGARILAVGDGEGRNGVWLARQGFDVTSLDFSPKAQEKAQRYAESQGVKITTTCVDFESWSWPVSTFDVVTLIFVHVPPATRTTLLHNMVNSLKTHGLLFLEVFHRDQVLLQTGGPSNPELLYDEKTIVTDLPSLTKIVLRKTKTIVYNPDGASPEGYALQFVGQK